MPRWWAAVDSLCLTTLYGFHSLQLSSPRPCRPFDRGARRHFHRRGRAHSRCWNACLTAWIATPFCCWVSANRATPTTCRRLIRKAWARVAPCRQRWRRPGLDPGEIDYINLHGTGTPSNDRSESQAVTSVFGPTTPCSSTKGATGHTLGAAGALEAVISALALRNGLMPGGVHTTHIDPTLTAHYIRENRRARVSTRAQQFIRLRRHELQSDLRPRGMSLIGLRRRHRRARARACATGRRPPQCLPDGSPTCPRRTVLPMPAMLPPAERRRTGRVVKLRWPWRFEATAARRRQTLQSWPACSPPRAATATFAMRSARRCRSRAARYRRRVFPIPCTMRRPVIGASPPAPWRNRMCLCAFDASFVRRPAGGHDAGQRSIGASRPAGRLRHRVSRSRCMPSARYPMPSASPWCLTPAAARHSLARMTLRTHR